MKTPVLIVVVASGVVLCILPAIYIFLAYHTHRERQSWKADHDRALDKVEHEVRRNRRFARDAPVVVAGGATLPNTISPAPARALSAQHQQRKQRQQNAPKPPPPRRGPNVSRSSHTRLSQVDHAAAAPLAPPPTPPRGGRPAPRTRRSSVTGTGRSNPGSKKKQQQQQQSSAYGSTSDGQSRGSR
ncbi:hypothetical protein Daus18300_014104 [Diaporthe australafricana]|uniref:Uncharacterized protein n=1 Tax=Diaporthe australafricana TaxID=127596 RepID=A0ABR3VWI1_9PEZI